MDPSKDGVITRYPPILIKSKLIISNNSDFVRSKIEISIFHIDNTPLEGVVFYYDHPIRRLVPHPYFYGCRVTSRWECWLNKCSSNKLNQTLVSAGAGGLLPTYHWTSSSWSNGIRVLLNQNPTTQQVWRWCYTYWVLLDVHLCGVVLSSKIGSEGYSIGGPILVHTNKTN